MRPFFILLVLCGYLAPAAAADGFVLPPGFNLETRPLPGPLTAVLEDGTVLLSTGSFGADELSVLHSDGTVTLWADGIGSLGGVAQSPITGDVIVGDSFGSSPLWILRDVNGDGDALDIGERIAHPAALPVLSNGAAPLPFELVFRPGTDELYMSGSTPFGIVPTLGVVVRIEGSSASVYADGLGLASGILSDGEGLLLCDVNPLTFAGRVVRLTDLDGNGTALDPGEAVDFAAGLSGAFDLVLAQDGSVYVSGLLDWADFSSPVGRLLPDVNGDGVSDGVDELYFDGFAFSATLVLIEGTAGLVPGAGGDGELYVGDAVWPGPTLVRRMRSAPRAELAVTGIVANNSTFALTVSGEPGAVACLAMSLDTVGLTLPGIGDLCLGFSQPWVLSVPVPLGPSGSVVTPVRTRDADAAVGLPFVVQAFTFESSDIGISNDLHLTLAP